MSRCFPVATLQETREMLILMNFVGATLEDGVDPSMIHRRPTKRSVLGETLPAWTKGDRDRPSQKESFGFLK